eukprot:636379-Amphidinium_carterae.1
MIKERIIRYILEAFGASCANRDAGTSCASLQPERRMSATKESGGQLRTGARGCIGDSSISTRFGDWLQTWLGA